MSHPPIPEDCEYFDRVNGRYVWAPSYIEDSWLDSPIPETRCVIAALARCAWLDMRKGPIDVSFQKQCEGGDVNNFFAKLDGWTNYCEANAEAWRVWGLA